MIFTPAIQQYLDVKKQYADCILFFRIGDFYETFFEDAKICSKALDIILTSKNKNSENSVPMAGIPHHSADKYITKLVSKGYKIAIAEQTTNPVPGKIVSREVVSIITPGTYIQEGNKNFSYIAGITYETHSDGYFYHLARGDFGVGEYWTKSFKAIEDVQKFLMLIKPVEIILDLDFAQKDELSFVIQQTLPSLISIFDVPVDPEKFIMNITHTQTLQSFGKALENGRMKALALLFHYLTHTQKKGISNIIKIGLHSQEKGLILDDVTIKNLEIFSSSYDQNEKYSLIGVLDNTKTVGGSRLLRYIISNPINDLQILRWRLDQIDYYFKDLKISREIQHILGQIMDVPKIMSSLFYKKMTPLNFVKLRSTLNILLEGNVIIQELNRLGLEEKTLKIIQDYFLFLKKLIKSDEKISEDLDYIADGYDNEIDEMRKIAYHSDNLLLEYQQELLKKTGVGNVKIKYILNQGYFIEVTNKDIQGFENALEKLKIDVEGNETMQSVEKFNLLRRNTLKGAQRYVSGYLDNIQHKSLEAKDKLIKLEMELLLKAKEMLTEIATEMSEFANKVSWLDVFVSQAILAYEKKYIKPDLNQSYGILIENGRHPVIQEFLPKDQQFIPNTLKMSEVNNLDEIKVKRSEIPQSGNERKKIETDHEDVGFLHIVTGPNMGGKSTFLRQNALIILMAHAGLFVPANKCEIGLVDGIFARIGSGDVIAKNQSTFLTEMIEVANIINNATKKSFVVFDELGRGTSTYDGLALTKSILEYFAKNIGCKTLIATHYHELIGLENEIIGVKNYSVSVYETEKEVVFLKKIVKGGASKSYGLDVAKLAGITKEILVKAKEHLQELEIKSKGLKENDNLNKLFAKQEINLKSDPKFDKIKAMLSSFDTDNMTPLQALQFLAKIKEIFEE